MNGTALPTDTTNFPAGAWFRLSDGAIKTVANNAPAAGTVYTTAGTTPALQVQPVLSTVLSTWSSLGST